MSIKPATEMGCKTDVNYIFTCKDAIFMAIDRKIPRQIDRQCMRLYFCMQRCHIPIDRKEGYPSFYHKNIFYKIFDNYRSHDKNLKFS